MQLRFLIPRNTSCFASQKKHLGSHAKYNIKYENFDIWQVVVMKENVLTT